MSMQEEGIKVCCTSGTPTNTGGCENYKPTGHVIQLPDSGSLCYITRPTVGDTSSQAAIFVVYDIFGFHIPQTRRFADELADKTKMRVLMPDFFRDKPWLLSNFPPKDRTEFSKWVETAGSWKIVSKDLKSAHRYLLSDGLPATAAFGILGFCWGGKQAIRACSGQTHTTDLGFEVSAGVSLHGAFFDPNDAHDVTVPMLLMPAGDDPLIDPLKTILDDKPFGSKCEYHRFEDETHGFAAARGDWNVEHTRNAIKQAIHLTSMFFQKHLHQ